MLGAPVIEATIHHQTVQPRFKFGFAAELTDFRQQLEEGILGDVERYRRVAGKPQGDGVDAIAMSVEQGGKGVVIAALAGLNQLTVHFSFWGV